MICCRAGLARLQILRFHQNVVARLLDLGIGKGNVALYLERRVAQQAGQLGLGGDREMTGRLDEEEPADRVWLPSFSGWRNRSPSFDCVLLLKREGRRSSARRSRARKSLPVWPTKLMRLVPVLETSRLTGTVPP